MDHQPVEYNITERDAMGEHEADYRVETRSNGRLVVSKRRAMRHGRVKATLTKVMSLDGQGDVTLVTISEGFEQTPLPADETHPMLGRPLPDDYVHRSGNGSHINVDRSTVK